jgi:putative MATE family efflux protein
MDNTSSTTLVLLASGLFVLLAGLVFVFRHKLTSKHNLLEGSINRGIIGFTIPLMISSFFQQFYTAVDTMMLSNFVGSHAVGALGPSGMIYFLILSLMIGFTVGGSVLISQYYGAKDWKGLSNGIETFYLAILVGAAVVTVVGYLVAPLALDLIDTPLELREDALSYLRVLFLGTIFAFGYNGVSGVLRSTGDSITPLLFLIISTAINIVLDYVFIARFGWGVAGVAWATLVAQAASLVMALVYMGRHKIDHLRFHLHKLTFDRPLFKKMVNLGLPASIQQAVISFSLVLLSKLVNGHGMHYTTAYSAIQRLDSFIILPGLNFMMTVSTFVGQNMGAKQYDRLKKGVGVTLLIGVGFNAIITLIIALSPELFLSFFLQPGPAIALGVEYFVITLWFYPIATAMFIYSGAIRGAGRAMVSMAISILISLVIRIPLATVLNSIMGVHGVWWSFVITWGVGALLNMLYWHSGVWRNKASLVD